MCGAIRSEIQCHKKIINVPWIIIALVLIVGINCQDKKIQHKTSSTHCTITFKIENGSVDTGQNHIFQKCEMAICRKYHIQGHCLQEDLYILDESKCYWDCCRSNTYDWRQCEDYNEQYAIREENSNRQVIIGLSISLSILLIAVLIFISRYMKCCASKEEVNNCKGYECNEKDAQWKKSVKQFSVQNKQCNICKMKQAFVMHSCGTMYHLKCLEEIEDEWSCKHCQKPIKKLRLYCIVCLNRYITLKADSFEEFEQKVKQGYTSHPQSECFELMRVELDTDRKLTATTNG